MLPIARAEIGRRRANFAIGTIAMMCVGVNGIVGWLSHFSGLLEQASTGANAIGTLGLSELLNCNNLRVTRRSY